MDTLPVNPPNPQAARPRVLFVITQAEWGGAQTFFFKAAQEAVHRGYDILMTAGGTGAFEERCLAAGVPYRRLWKLRRELTPFGDIAAINELMGVIHEFKPDIVFLNSSKAGVIGSIAARLAGVKRVIYRIGGWSFLDPVSPLQQFIRRWSEKLTAGLKDIIITVHPGDEAIAKETGIHPRKQIITIPNGLDVATFDQTVMPYDAARTELLALTHAPADAHLLLTIANFYPAKGLSDYLDALALVCKQEPKTHAIIIGDGELRVELEEKRKALGLESFVTFAGRISDAQRLIKGADAFVLPSRKEGMSWALLEAMAGGVPIIATDVAANRWMIEDAGWIIPAQQPEAMAGAILEALHDAPLAQTRGAAAHLRVETAFTQQTMWESLFKLFS